MTIGSKEEIRVAALLEKVDVAANGQHSKPSASYCVSTETSGGLLRRLPDFPIHHRNKRIQTQSLSQGIILKNLPQDILCA